MAAQQIQPTKEDIARVRSFLASKGLRKSVSVKKGVGSLRRSLIVRSYSITREQAIEIMQFLRSIGLDTGPSEISDMNALIKHNFEFIDVAVSRWVKI